MHQSHSPVRPEGTVRSGTLDRNAVIDSLKRWLDTVLPVSALKLTYTIKVEPFSAASPVMHDGNTSIDGNFSRDGNVSRDGSSSASASTSSHEKPDEFERPEIVVVFDGPDKDLLLERGAELLLALEYLAVRSLRLEPPFFDRIRFDSGDFRALRIAELMLSAKVAAQRVRETRQPFRLNPMAPRERRIVHLALKDLAGIRTSSEGVGEERQVVILPAPDAKK
jgi:spoIIIJ-associated protein